MRSRPPCATRSTPTGRSGLLSQARTAPSPIRLVLRAPVRLVLRAPLRLVLRAPHQRGARAYYLKPELPRVPSALCYALHTNGALGLTISSPNCPESPPPCATRSKPTGRSGLLSQARTAPSPLRLVLRAPHQRGARAYFLKPELPRVPSALCYALQTNGALGLTFSSPNCPESQVKRMRLSPAPSVSKLRISRRAFWSRGVNLT